MENQHNESNKQHRPITSDFYEELESSASLNQICEITFRDDQGVEQQMISPVKNLYTEDGVEYVRLEGRIIRLDNITSVNGKTDGTGQIHTDILERDRMPKDAPYISPTDGLPPHEGHTSYDNNPQINVTQQGNDGNFKGNVGDIGKTGIPSVDNSSVQPVRMGTVHQSEVVKDNLLGMETAHTHHHAVIIDTPDYETQEYPVQQDTHSDFVHRYTTSTTPFVLGENEYYILTAHRMQNRLYLTVKQNWYDADETPELGGYIAQVAPLMSEGCTMLIDLTGLTPDEDDSLISPAVGSKSALFDAGLTRVAELVPYTCETLVHGPDSFSVNSVRLRYFKDRMQAEHWLTDDALQVGTPDDMDLN